MLPAHVRVAVKLLKTSIIRQEDFFRYQQKFKVVSSGFLKSFVYTYSVESSEIDLSDFQDHEDGVAVNVPDQDAAELASDGIDPATENGGRFLFFVLLVW